MKNEIVLPIYLLHTKQEPCNPPEKSTEETSTVDNLNEPKPDDKDGNENSQSYQAIKDGSETWISNTASTGLSKPIEDNNNILGTMVRKGRFHLS